MRPMQPRYAGVSCRSFSKRHMSADRQLLLSRTQNLALQVGCLVHIARAAACPVRHTQLQEKMMSDRVQLTIKYLVRHLPTCGRIDMSNVCAEGSTTAIR